MTKKEWNNLKIGKSRVKKMSSDWDKDKTKIVEVERHGVVTRSNSNCSQVIVQWDNGISSWYGRTQIEML